MRVPAASTGKRTASGSGGGRRRGGNRLRKRRRGGDGVAVAAAGAWRTYICSSARRWRVEESSPSSGNRAIPMLLVTTSCRPPTPNGSRRQLTSFSATFVAPSRAASSGSTTMNSSPPIRASVSVSRNCVRRRWANCWSSASPASWPRVSLTCLKWSTSSDEQGHVPAAAARQGGRLLEAVLEAERGWAGRSAGRGWTRWASRRVVWWCSTATVASRAAASSIAAVGGRRRAGVAAEGGQQPQRRAVAGPDRHRPARPHAVRRGDRAVGPGQSGSDAKSLTVGGAADSDRRAPRSFRGSRGGAPPPTGPPSGVRSHPRSPSHAASGAARRYAPPVAATIRRRGRRRGDRGRSQNCRAGSARPVGSPRLPGAAPTPRRPSNCRSTIPATRVSASRSGRSWATCSSTARWSASNVSLRRSCVTSWICETK